VIQRGEHFGFPLKASHPLDIARQGRRQHLDGHLPLQLQIGRPVDLAHSAHADLRGDFIRTEAGTWMECHAGQPPRLYEVERNECDRF
jgi:hypothetical protein